MNDENEWQDQYLEEEFSTIIDSLGDDGARVISISKTDRGYKFVECCDGYYGTTLSQEQFERFLSELQKLAGVNS